MVLQSCYVEQSIAALVLIRITLLLDRSVILEAHYIPVFATMRMFNIIGFKVTSIVLLLLSDDTNRDGDENLAFICIAMGSFHVTDNRCYL